MKNNRKRFLSLLLVLVMVIALMPAAHVHAASQVAAAAATDLGLANVGDSAKFVIVSAVSPSLEMVANVGTNGSGQTGFELAFEEHLHGIDGTRVDIVNKDGAIINQYYAKEKDAYGNIKDKAPVAGNNVETTLDITIQQVAEEALEDVMLRSPTPRSTRPSAKRKAWTPRARRSSSWNARPAISWPAPATPPTTWPT